MIFQNKMLSVKEDKINAQYNGKFSTFSLSLIKAKDKKYWLGND